MPPPDVYRHLAHALRGRWKQHRKRLKRCQADFCRSAVHDTRVSTRKLLSLLTLLETLLPDAHFKPLWAALKELLHSFGVLRDTQVQLKFIKPLADDLRGADAVYGWLQRREKRQTGKARKVVKHTRLKQLDRQMTALEKAIRSPRKHSTPTAAAAALLDAMRRAFADAEQLRRCIRSADPATIHRARIAFKRLRYMLEDASPWLVNISKEQRLAMRDHQRRMGEVQDLRLLRKTVEKFAKKEKKWRGSLSAVKGKLARRQKEVIRCFMKRSRKIQSFRPPGEEASLIFRPIRR